MIRKSLLCSMLAVIMLVSVLFSSMTSTAHAEGNELTDVQRNAIAMLNYITVLTQEINESKNSRLYMEEAYSKLINNTYPNAVDSLTLSQLTGLLDTMENYRMVSVKRDRLQFIYEQNQAKAIRAAIPNPLGLIGALQSGSKVKMAVAIAYMAVDSVTSYAAATEELDMQYLQDGWALDDEEAATLHNSRKNTFSYMIKMVRDYDVPGDLALTEKSVEEFVKWKNNTNTVARIHFLESNKDTYRNYGGYWLLLAESYYDNGDYQKCLKSIDAYEALDVRIFRKDYEYSRVLPLAINAAEQVYSSADYVPAAKRYADQILNNCDHEDWALRYFAAQTYIELYGRTLDINYLQTAYSIVLDNVNYLVSEQRTMNATYLAPVAEATAPKDATKEEKQQIKNYNKLLKEQRKVELPPVYEPLQLNCDLLFAIADKLNLQVADKTKINSILHPDNEPLYLSSALDRAYWFDDGNSPANPAKTDLDGLEYAGTAIKLPCTYVTSGTVITVSITEEDGNTAEYNDWKFESLSRGKEANVESFTAIYTSESAKKHEWKPNADIIITITPKEGSLAATLSAHYTTVNAKTAWYDYLKVWEGQNNEWYDYLKVWESKVKFERKTK